MKSLRVAADAAEHAREVEIDLSGASKRRDRSGMTLLIPSI